MVKYHINPATGDPGKCSAQSGNCPFGTDEDHYANPTLARKAFEQRMELLAALEKEEENWHTLQKESIEKAARYFSNSTLEVVEHGGYEGELYIVVRAPETDERFRISSIDELGDGVVSHYTFEELGEDSEGIIEVSVRSSETETFEEILKSIESNERLDEEHDPSCRLSWDAYAEDCECGYDCCT